MRPTVMYVYPPQDTAPEGTGEAGNQPLASVFVPSGQSATYFFERIAAEMVDLMATHGALWLGVDLKHIEKVTTMFELAGWRRTGKQMPQEGLGEGAPPFLHPSVLIEMVRSERGKGELGEDKEEVVVEDYLTERSDLLELSTFIW